MKTTHTPGPWYVERPYGEPGTYVAESNSGLVAKIYPPDGITSHNKGIPVSEQANARLIAAAPDLLNMLQRMVFETAEQHITPEGVILSRPCLLTHEQARAAIKKALEP